MRVKLKKLNDKAIMPDKKKPGDFCYDVVATEEKEVAPNVWQYKLGFAYELDDNDFRLKNWNKTAPGEKMNVCISFRPRSSVWKTGMVLSNSIGTLDEFYRGEVMAVFYHVMPNMPRYKVGDRIGQIYLSTALPMQFEWVDEINMDTERGEGGFGSTGK